MHRDNIIYAKSHGYVSTTDMQTANVCVRKDDAS